MGPLLLRGVSHAEGHLGTELLRVREAFEKLPPGGFVLLDELCSGTNPAEAHELIELVVELLGKLGMQAFISTHFLDLAGRLGKEHQHDMAFFQVEVDADRRPTYRVVDGIATSSLARETASRLGVTRDELLALTAAARQDKGR
jgi:DNA mismatch repair protein MutS2